jgi:acyl CoA:acetate/3-ketoacid CoA transferase beta subunit
VVSRSFAPLTVTNARARLIAIKGSEEMATRGLSATELLQHANMGLRAKDGCKTATVISVKAIPEVKDGRNWEIDEVRPGSTRNDILKRGIITVNFELSRQFHLLVD